MASSKTPRPQMNDDWRRWIAENLMLGNHPAGLAQILLKSGIADGKAEIEAALRSPYLQGARRLHNRLAKRDWVLEIPSKLSRLGDTSVQRRHRLSGEDFLQQHYRSNTPVILTGMLDDCPARTRWSLDYFKQAYGERMVEVQYGRSADPDYEKNSIAHKRDMRFGDYVDMVRDSGHTNDFYMTANNDSRNRAALHELWQDVPTLPEYLQPQPGNTGFFWFGPAGTVTPFHHDLTNNFMAQIVGRKKVRMIAPWEVANVYNQRHCFSEVDGRQIDLERFPAMAKVNVIDCVLEPGEILFLPVGWWHFVEGLDISITVSATNFRWDNDYYSNYPADHDF
ncbi:cupin-like domain-containing protein [Oxalobacteraceae bacterium]|nr:cupin-like domain-containing protein [Oxalobacteraceae bacterium]